MSLTAAHMKYAFPLCLQAGCGERLRRTHDDSRFRWTRCLTTISLILHLLEYQQFCYSMCSGTLVTVRPVANIQEDSACTSPLRYHHQGVTFSATTLDCHHTQSPKAIRNTEDVTKTSPTEETASNALSTSELAIIFHRPLPIALKRPPLYPRDGTFGMNFSQSCINLVSYAPAVEVTTTGHDDCEPLLHLTIIPEQESLSSNEDAELVF